MHTDERDVWRYLLRMQVSMRHTRLFKQDDDFWIEDLGSERGTWLNGTKMRAQQRQMVSPGDEVVVGEKGSPSHTFRIKRVHSSVWDQVLRHCHQTSTPCSVDKERGSAFIKLLDNH